MATAISYTGMEELSNLIQADSSHKGENCEKSAGEESTDTKSAESQSITVVNEFTVSHNKCMEARASIYLYTFFQEEQLYCELLYQIHHALGNDINQEQRQQILAHLKSAFNIEDKKHADKLKEAQNKDVRSCQKFQIIFKQFSQ
jgi:hypothetical protein